MRPSLGYGFTTDLPRLPPSEEYEYRSSGLLRFVNVEPVAVVE